MSVKSGQDARVQRKQRIRKKVFGTTERLRLTVFRSLNHIYAQIVNDEIGHVVAAASTLSPELESFEGHRGNMEAARAVGKLIAEKALAASVQKVVFDRNGFLYHGRIQALADAAREAGLEF